MPNTIPGVTETRLGRRNLGYGFLVAPLLAALALALAPAPARGRNLYVVQEETESVAVIDTATNQVTVPSIGIGKSPEEIAITPDGTRAYVVNHGSDSVSVISTQTNQVIVPAIEVGEEPIGLAISPNGTRAYVANGDSESVSVIDTATNQVTATIPLGGAGYAEAIAVSPDGTRAYVSIYEPDPSVILTIDTATNQLIGAPIVAGEGADSIAITPDGRTAYVANANSGNVTPIDLLTRQAGSQIEVGLVPVTVAITPDGRTAYVAAYNGGEVAVIDTATNQLGTPIPFKKNRPFKIAFTPDGKSAYISATEAGAVFPITTSSNAAGSAISVGEPFGIAITPDQPPIASFTATVARPGVPVTFNSAASSDPDGSIVSYGWEFGDGQSVTSSGAVVQHTYPKPGSRTVTLAATDNEGCSVAEVFTGQTAYCNAGARAARIVTVAYPGVRLKCPKSAKPAGCKFKLVAVKKRKHRVKAESAIAKAKLKAGHSKIVSLRPKKAFAKKLAPAKKILVKETATIAGSTRISFRKLKIVR
jgi:YVTN family beta-propeller protein